MTITPTNPATINDSHNSEEVVPIGSFQIFSDLHLELPFTLDKMPEIVPVGSICCLLGDISTIPKRNAYDKLLQRLSPLFQTILVCLGNHEYYHESYSKANQFWHNYFEHVVPEELNIRNVVLMDCNRWDLEGTDIRFLGATLWTEIDAVSTVPIEKQVNDYKHIFMMEDQSDAKKRPIRASDITNIHRRELQWLQNELQIAKQLNKRVVILTHHAPTLQNTSSPQYTTECQQAFLVEVLKDKLQEQYGDIIECCCFGHTHYNVDFILKQKPIVDPRKSIRIVSNQLGHYMKGARIGFDGAKVIHIY